MPIDEDPADFLDVDEHADVAVIGTTSVKGIYARQYVDTDDIEGHHPTFYAPTENLNTAAPSAAIKHNDIVNLSGSLHQVRGIQPDETGTWTLLVLEKVT